MKTYVNYFVQPGRYLKNTMYKLITKFWYSHFLGQLGKKTLIIHPLKIDNPQNIKIGSQVCINDNAWLCAGKMSDEEYKYKISEVRASGRGGGINIGNNVQIGHYAHIVGWYCGITIEDNVLIADKVYISDCSHSYENIQQPILHSSVKPLSKVSIGEGSWLGENVVINGSSVGKHCVIGANSFVNIDIPDYCVAVGQPAQVVKRYDIKQNEWLKVKVT